MGWLNGAYMQYMADDLLGMYGMNCRIAAMCGDKLKYLSQKISFSTTAQIAGLAALVAVVSACSTPKPGSIAPKPKSKEYFSEKEYGVKASPRVSLKSSRLRRGGGREQVGKPYKVRGKWYYPKNVKSYSKVGKASWYGSAFHGRLTANGEIYDMTHLTAAHPTLPLPSYARVTNLKNGNSVVVRVNDRGPFAHGRIIDLSKRAAQLLDYTHSGIAKVKVDYIGRAPLHGQDDSYLIASYRPGGRAPDPSDGLATGVMIAMNGPTPEGGAKRPPRFVNSGAKLPEAGPILPDRPRATVLALDADNRFSALGYAASDKSAAASVLEKMATAGMKSEQIIGSWKRQRRTFDKEQTAIFAGSYSDVPKAEALANILSKYGRTVLETSHRSGGDWTSITLLPDDHIALNDALRAAWTAGATDAMILRD